MHPLLNPVTAIRCYTILKRYPKNLRMFSQAQMQKFQTKSFVNLLRYASHVPVYRSLYTQKNIKLREIKNLTDITKLPLVSKKTIMDAYPTQSIPEKRYYQKHVHPLSTSGSTGKSITFYTDFLAMTYGASLYLRELSEFGLNWKTTRFAHIGNFTPGKADSTFDQGFTKKMGFFILKNTTLILNAFDPLKDTLNRLNTFKPDLIMSYPVTLQHLAYAKMKGLGEQINPKIIAVGGYVLDEYTRTYIKDAFHCPVLNVYASAESGGDIAFECLHGTWHVNYDYYLIEAIDDQGNRVSPGEIGHIVLTRLFGRGTPFIRYTGMDDWVSIIDEYACPCGLTTPILHGGVAGRANTSIILPDGRLFPAASFAILSVVLKELKTNKVKQFQIIQQTLNRIDILLVIDPDLRDADPPVDVLMQKIQEIYEKKVGPEVTITVKEVESIPSPKNKPAPLVISHVPQEQRYKIIAWGSEQQFAAQKKQ
ncbi:MAG: hypothetical protein QXL17_00480 [Candidatus Thermoplasmatota archaeon]